MRLLIISTILLISYFGMTPISAESTPPIIINQVELSSPLRSDPKTVCVGFESIGGGSSTQWMELKNITGEDIQIHGFTIRADKDEYGTGLQYGPDLSNMIEIKSGQSCTYSFHCAFMENSDQRCIQDTKNVIFTFEYNYEGIPYADGDYLYSDGGTVYKSSTPPLSDEMNDAKTWQFVEDEWVFDNMQMRTISSPLQQFKSGLPIDMIQCDEELQLVLKTDNNSPACVKPETKQKLIERGWAKPI
jgi:hypothetical protein